MSTFETYIPLVRRLPPLPLPILLLICTARPLGHMTHLDQSQTSRHLATDRGIVVYTWLPTLERSGRVSPTFYPHSTHTLHTLYPHSTHTLPTLYPHSTHTLPTLYPHSTHTLHTLYTHSTHTLPIPYTHSTHTLPTLYTHSTHTLHTLYLYPTHTLPTLYPHSTHTLPTLYPHYPHSTTTPTLYQQPATIPVQFYLPLKHSPLCTSI